MLAYRLPLTRRARSIAPTADEWWGRLVGKPRFATSRTPSPPRAHRARQRTIQPALRGCHNASAVGYSTYARLRGTDRTAADGRWGLAVRVGGRLTWDGAMRLSNGRVRGGNLRRRSTNLCRNAGSPLNESAAALG
jgi:hypothetical protein